MAELEASRQSILARLGPAERFVVGRHWGVIEEEVPRIVQAAMAEAIRRLAE